MLQVEEKSVFVEKNIQPVVRKFGAQVFFFSSFKFFWKALELSGKQKTDIESFPSIFASVKLVTFRFG